MQSFLFSLRRAVVFELRDCIDSERVRTLQMLVTGVAAMTKVAVCGGKDEQRIGGSVSDGTFQTTRRACEVHGAGV